MSSAAWLFAGAVGMLVGRLLHGRWFNHVTLYSAIWGGTLSLTTLGLIHYYPIIPAARGFIALAWVQLAVGSALALALFPSRGTPGQAGPHIDVRGVTIAVCILTALAAAALLVELLGVWRSSGNLATALVEGMNARYVARIAGRSDGVPYVGAVAYTATALSGVLASYQRRITLLALLPLFIVAVEGLTTAGRTGIGMGAALFLTAYALSVRRGSDQDAAPGIGGGLALLLVLTLGIAGFMVISAARGLVVDFPGVDPAMARFSRFVPFFPSLFAHFSASPVTFSEYLKSDPHGAALGSNTFAPFVRVLARAGVGSGVPFYEQVYYTPVPTNVGTWLKNIHADFGAVGIALVPLIFGALITGAGAIAERSGRLVPLMVACHLLAVILLSFTFDIMVLGDWWVSFLVAIGVAHVLDKSGRRQMDIFIRDA